MLLYCTKVSEYDQEIPQYHTADQPMAPRGRVQSMRGTILPARSDSDFMFCLHSYQGLIIDRSLVF